MIGLCLAAVGSALEVFLPVAAFTLAWTHSVERVAWQEDYRILDQRLVLVEARIRGSGAGMEPPPDAELRDGWWRYRPALAPLRSLRLARSRHAGDYRLCAAGRCTDLGALLPAAEDGAVTEVRPCKPAS